MQNKKSKYEILKDLYSERSGAYYEYGLAESLDEDNFPEKLASLEERRKTTIPRFHEWFLNHWKVLFEESGIQSVCINFNVQGLYYQNTIESKHSDQKCIQEYKDRDVVTVIKNLLQLSDRQDV